MLYEVITFFLDADVEVAVGVTSQARSRVPGHRHDAHAEPFQHWQDDVDLLGLARIGQRQHDVSYNFV